jgi:AcrR family transcriptional regulator
VTTHAVNDETVAETPGIPSAPPANPRADAPVSSSASTLREQFLEARRAEILEAARGVFVAKGCDAASMQQIAKAAGVSAGNIYRYFPNKDALIVAVCEECEIADRERFASVSAANASPLGALFAMGDSAFAQFTDDNAREATMLTLESALVAARNDEFGPAVERQTAALRDALAELLRAAQNAGELDSSVNAQAFGDLLLSVVSGMRLMQLQVNGSVDADGVWTLLQRIVRGFGTEGVATNLDEAR